MDVQELVVWCRENGMTPHRTLVEILKSIAYGVLDMQICDVRDVVEREVGPLPY